MLHSLRTVALLMLIAGVCMGLFASTLMASKPAVVRPNLDERIEERVKAYRDLYDLDVATTDLIRRELQRHRRGLRDLLLALREQNRADFSNLVKTTESRIDTILKGSR